MTHGYSIQPPQGAGYFSSGVLLLHFCATYIERVCWSQLSATRPKHCNDTVWRCNGDSWTVLSRVGNRATATANTESIRKLPASLKSWTLVWTRKRSLEVWVVQCRILWSQIFMNRFPNYLFSAEEPRNSRQLLWNSPSTKSKMFLCTSYYNTFCWRVSCVRRYWQLQPVPVRLT